MGTVRIVHTCPICGNSKWVRLEDEDFVFQCVKCSSVAYPETMCSKAEATICLADITRAIGEWMETGFDDEVPRVVSDLLRSAYEASALTMSQRL